MFKLYILPAAQKDLEDIFDYTADFWSFDQAVKYFNLLDGCIMDISQSTIVGKAYQHSNKPYKFVKSGRHLIFYRIDGNSCVIVRILHEKMDIENIDDF